MSVSGIPSTERSLGISDGEGGGGSVLIYDKLKNMT